MNFKDDVIIIGSGIGGLSAGAYLSRKGYKVKIFERLNQIGGLVNTIKRKDYLFEASTHMLCGFRNRLYVKKSLDILGIKNINFNVHENSFEAILFNNRKIDKRFIIKAGYKEAFNSLISYFPEDKNIIYQFLSEFKKIAIEVAKVRRLEREFPLFYPHDLIPALCLLNGKNNSLIQKIGIKYYKYLVKYKDKTMKDMFSSINNQALKYIFSQLCYFVGASPSIVAAYIISLLIYNFILQHPVTINGGMKKLLDELLSIIKQNNGEINLKTNIDEIIIKDGNAIGIKTENGDQYYAKYIFSNTTAINTYKKLIKDDKYFDKELKEKINNYRSSVSVFQIYLGLPFNIGEYGFPSSTTFFSNSMDFDNIFKDNIFPDMNSSFVLTNYRVSNPEFYTGNKSGLVIAESDNINRWKDIDKEKYKTLKENTQNIIIEKVTKLTGIPLNKAEVCFSATPKTIAYYSGNPYGGLVGAEINMEQSALNRFKCKSPIKNLFLVGADTNAAGGISESLDSGIVAVNYMLRD